MGASKEPWQDESMIESHRIKQKKSLTAPTEAIDTQTLRPRNTLTEEDASLCDFYVSASGWPCFMWVHIYIPKIQEKLYMNLNDNCKSLLADTNFLFYFSLLKEQTKKENQQRMQLQLHLRWQRLQLQSYSMEKWMPRLELLIQGRWINSFVVWSSLIQYEIKDSSLHLPASSIWESCLLF